jgi:hypothetical protein
VHTSFFTKILESILTQKEQAEALLLAEKTAEKEREEEAEEEKLLRTVETDILQNTERAILARRLIDNLLRREGFTVNRNNIFIMSEDLTEFTIILAAIDQFSSVRFDYNKTNQTLKDFRGKYSLEAHPGRTDLGLESREEATIFFEMESEFTWEELPDAFAQKIEVLEGPWFGIEKEIPEEQEETLTE